LSFLTDGVVIVLPERPVTTRNAERAY